MAHDGKQEESGRDVDGPFEDVEAVESRIAEAGSAGDAVEAVNAIDTANTADTADTAGSLKVWRRDAFWPDTVHACAPLAIWAGHFFGSYVFVAIGCRARLDSQVVFGLPLLTLGLLALTAGALVWMALMLFGRNSVFSLRRQRSHGMQRGPATAGYPPGATAFRTGAAALSLVAVTWTTPPMLLLVSCLQ